MSRTLAVSQSGPVMHLAGTLALSTAQASRAGRKPSNDDSYGLYVPDDTATLTTKGAAAVICDGVSAADAGREAAELCARGFLDDYFGTPEQWSVETSAQKVLASLNRWLFGQGRRYPDAQRGYVCTLSACILKGGALHVFHVGDSRVYRLRGGVLVQLTEDHTLRVSAGTRYLARAMGLDVSLSVDHRVEPAEVGDVYLMTTDGVHDFVAPELLAHAFASAHDGEALQRATEAVLDAALAGGSDDNLTCQVLRVDGLALPDEATLQQALHRLPFPPPLRVGEVLDGYAVEEVLHESPRSHVYRVREPASGAVYAMKTPSPLCEGDDAYVERFVLEQWIGTRVHSPHVVRVITPARPPRYLYQLQEFIAGKTLDAYAAALPRREPAAVVALVSQLVRGVLALHRKETVHRDLKPDNVLVGDDGVVRVLDFGSCHVAGIGEIPVPLQRDTVLGTASYGAPEALDGAPPSPQADLFSVGVITYELLTGALPYGPRSDELRSARDYAQLPYTPASHHNPHVPPWMDAALRKAVRVDPRLRYRELSELVHDLTRPNPELVELSPAPLVVRDPVRFWRVLALLLVALELCTVFYFTRIRPRAAPAATPWGEGQHGGGRGRTAAPSTAGNLRKR